MGSKLLLDFCIIYIIFHQFRKYYRQNITHKVQSYDYGG